MWYHISCMVRYATICMVRYATSCMLRYAVSCMVRFVISFVLLRYAISCLVQYVISWMVRYATSCMVLYDVSYCTSLWCDRVIQSWYQHLRVMYIRHVMSHDLMSCHFFILPMFCLALVLFSYCYLYSSISPVTLAHTFLGCLELVYFFFAVHSRTTSRGRSVTHGVYCILIRVLHEDANGRFLFSAVFVFVRTVLKQRIQEFPVCEIGLYQGTSN